MVLLTTRLNNILSKFVFRSRDPLAFSVDVLVIQWEQFNLIYIFQF